MWTKLIELLSSKKNQQTSDHIYFVTDYTDLDYTNIANNNMATTIGTSTGGYSISTSPTVNTGGFTSMSGSGSYNWATSTITPTFTLSTGPNGAEFKDSDITLSRKDKPPMKIGETLDMILESLYIIIPDESAHKDNPALKSAYDEWYSQFKEQTARMYPLKNAYDSYMTMKKLCHEDEE